MTIERTTKGLAEALFDELERLESGEVTPQHARSFASIASQVCSVSKLEMDFARFVSDDRATTSNKVGSALKPLRLAG